MLKFVAVLAISINIVDAFRLGTSGSRVFLSSLRMVTMSDPVVVEETVIPNINIDGSASTKTAADFSIFSVGQEYDGTVISSKTFGVFVDIKKGFNVLVPKSKLSVKNYEKLSNMAKEKSSETIKIELINVSAENKTLSGKYINPLQPKERSDMTLLAGKDVMSKFYNATVISAHDFGVFASLDELNVEGLIPTSKLPENMTPGSAKKTYTVGTRITVQVADVNIDAKKLILTMRFANRPGVEAFESVPKTKWFQSIVQRVESYGIFVRPAGFDSVGLVHNRRIPRDLFAALKKKMPYPVGVNKTDTEIYFSEGDVIRCRVDSVDVTGRRLELSMSPFASDEEEDDYIVVGRDPEGEESIDEMNAALEDEEEEFDAESTLLWWRGAPYEKTVASEAVVDEELEIINESAAVIEGTWRRMFEIDIREDEADFSAKALEAEIEELREEIGELEGMDEDMDDSLGFGLKFNRGTFGGFVSKSILPAGWAEEMEFFREKETYEKEIDSKLRGGKKAEQLEMEKLISEVEKELQMSTPRRSREVEREVDPTAESVSASLPEEPVMSTISGLDTEESTVTVTEATSEGDSSSAAAE